MGEINSELILLIVNFLPGLVASRCRFVRTKLGEQLIVLFTAFCIYCVNCQHSVRYCVITFSVTSSICCQEFHMGMRLEEGVRIGRLTREVGSSSGTRKVRTSFPKKKEHDIGMVSRGKPRKNVNQQRQVAAIAPAVSASPNTGIAPQFQQTQQTQQPRQQAQQFNNQNYTPRVSQFDPIPMTYTELYPALIGRNLVQTRSPPPVPEKLPWWYKANVSCPFHQGAPGHDLEHCIALKAEVQRLVRTNLLSFRNTNLNVQANPLPSHSGHSVNLMLRNTDRYLVTDVNLIRGNLVHLHQTYSSMSTFTKHDYAACNICYKDLRGCPTIKADIQHLLDLGDLQVYRNRDDHDVNTVGNFL